MKNEYTVNFEMFKEWLKRNRFKGMWLFLHIAYGFFFVAFLCFAVWSALKLDLVYTVYFSVLTLLSAYLVLFRFDQRVKSTYKKNAQIIGKDSWTTTIIFEEDCIHVIEAEKFEMRLNYTDVIKIIENGDLVILRLPGKRSLRVYKSAFVDSSWDECRAKLISENPVLAN